MPDESDCKNEIDKTTHTHKTPNIGHIYSGLQWKNTKRIKKREKNGKYKSSQEPFYSNVLLT